MMTKILMVCLGNICRSPLAEGILKSKLPSNKFSIDSAGTADYHIGDPPDPRSVDIAKKNQIDISHQRGRQFEVSDFDRFDIIYVMDNSNYLNIIHLARNKKDALKVKLILNELYANENMDVPDPYYGGSYGFKNVFEMLDEACNRIADTLLSEA
ncbi:MAG: low molecular weight phosphotyrosine protein phosphatase [Flavobacteriaceae bacterium]|nr:low molecular weight phosphotyrosine protein phosphatase [Flavobacteriaceae bacterium]